MDSKEEIHDRRRRFVDPRLNNFYFSRQLISKKNRKKNTH